MDRRHSIVLAILVAGAVHCGSKTESSGNPSVSPSPADTQPPATALPTTPSAGGTGAAGVPPQTLHTVTLTTSTDPGSAAAPSLVTYISESGADKMIWNGSTTTTFPSGTNLGVYTPTCNSNQCTSGNYTVTVGNCPTGSCVGLQFDYTVRVGTTTIYGRIIIKK